MNNLTKQMPAKPKTKSIDNINIELAKYELIIRQTKCKIKKILSQSFMDFLLNDFEYLTRLEVSIRYNIIPEDIQPKLNKLVRRYKNISLSPFDW